MSILSLLYRWRFGILQATRGTRTSVWRRIRLTSAIKSHTAAAFVKGVAMENRFYVFARRWEIDVVEKFTCRDSTSANPALNTARARIVLGERERQWLGFVLPTFKRPAQIPRAGFEIRLGIKELLEIEILDLVFVRPFIGGFLAHLHQAALARSSIFLSIEPALAPD